MSQSTFTPLKTVNCCAPAQLPHHATYVCETCGETESMGPDDARWHLQQFDYMYSMAAQQPMLTCRNCGKNHVICYLEP